MGTEVMVVDGIKGKAGICMLIVSLFRGVWRGKRGKHGGM